MCGCINIMGVVGRKFETWRWNPSNLGNHASSFSFSELYTVHWYIRTPWLRIKLPKKLKFYSNKQLGSSISNISIKRNIGQKDKDLRICFLKFSCNTYISKAKLSANYFFRFLIATKIRNGGLLLLLKANAFLLYVC